MVWIILILGILFVLYVIYSLSTIKYQLKQIKRHLNIRENEMDQISDEEIENELEDQFKK